MLKVYLWVLKTKVIKDSSDKADAIKNTLRRMILIWERIFPVSKDIKIFKLEKEENKTVQCWHVYLWEEPFTPLCPLRLRVVRTIVTPGKPGDLGTERWLERLTSSWRSPQKLHWVEGSAWEVWTKGLNPARTQRGEGSSRVLFPCGREWKHIRLEAYLRRLRLWWENSCTC